MDDPVAIQAFVHVVEKHNYKAYLMFTPEARRPPAAMHDFIQPLDRHPGMPDVKDTCCYDVSYYAILNMARFIHEYCLEFAATVILRGSATAKGFCGNIWFQKQGCD